MINKPLLFALTSYMLGICISQQCDIYRPNFPKTALFICGIVVLFIFLVFGKIYYHNYREGLVISKGALRALLCFFALLISLFGLFYTTQFNPRLLAEDPGHILFYLEGKTTCTIEGTICAPKEVFEDAERIILLLKSIKTASHHTPIPVNGKVRIMIYGLNTPLKYKDEVRINTKLRKPRGYRNEESFNYKRHIYSKGIYGVCYIDRCDQYQILKSVNYNGIVGSIFKLRARAGNVAELSIKDKETLSLFKALILGDRGGIDDEMEDILKKAGIYHILAVSGLHLGIVLIFFLILFKWIKIVIPASVIEKISHIAPYTKLTSLFCIVPLMFYTILTGMRISTLRALIMITFGLIALYFDRLKDIYSVLAWAAMIILLQNPFSLFEVSFQLTFVATFGIIFYVDNRPKFFGNRPTLRYCVDLFLMSIIAFIIIAPLCIFSFHYISFWGIIVTPIAIPLLTIIIPFGLVGILASLVNLSLAKQIIAFTGYILWISIRGLKVLTKLFFSIIPIPSPTIIALLLVYLTIFLIVLDFKCKRDLFVKYLYIPLAILFLSLSFFILSIHLRLRLMGEMEITFMDVGKGDAALIRMPSGDNLLIDGGGTNSKHFDIGKNVLIPFLWSKGVMGFKAVVVSHPHPDHINGLFAIIYNFPVDEIWIESETAKSPLFRKIDELTKKKQITQRIIEAGQIIRIAPSIDILCLSPPKAKRFSSPRGKSSITNNQSIVLKITYNKKSILFTGDIEKEAEDYLVKTMGEALTSDILKSPHHGSTYSNSPPFLKAVSPSITVISSRNISWYRLPAPTVLQRIHSIGSKIYTTEDEGAITIRTDGFTSDVSTWRQHQDKIPYKRLLDID